MHKTLIWERTRHVLRLRHALREYFPAALEAFEDLDAADTLELLSRAPDPVSAAKPNHTQIRAALKHARMRASPGARAYYENNAPAASATTPRCGGSAIAMGLARSAVRMPLPLRG